MIDGTAITAVRDLAQQAQSGSEKTVEIDGVIYSTVKLFDVRCDDPEPKPLTIHTLQGIVDYLHANRDGIALEKVVVHVAGPEAVNVMGPLAGRFQQRFVYLSSVLQPRMKGFSFGQYVSQSDMVIALNALFGGTTDREKLVQLISKIVVSAEVASTDDGHSQQVQTRKGISLQETVALPNPVVLMPFRTFAEVPQPLSEFIGRVRTQGDGPVSVALFEADGGRWQLDAVRSIREWLADKLPAGVTVVA